MMRGYIKSDPTFFRLIKFSEVACVFALIGLACIVPAPLQTAANPGQPPNPVKAAWFLLWIQELVSYSRFMIFPVIACAIFLIVLPFLPSQAIQDGKAVWFPENHRVVTFLVITIVIAIAILTLVAMLFRGENWHFAPQF